MKKSYNLSSLEWELWGFRPEGWRSDFDFNNVSSRKAEIRKVKVSVPGSVQKALLDGGLIKDWNIGINNVDCEWIENRNWIFITKIPDEWLKGDKKFTLNCKGLDDNGTIILNGKEIGKFDKTYIPYTFDLGSNFKKSDNTLAIVFDTPPKYLGQVCWTSKIKDWKPRFYYGWDWIPRIVQIGIWDDILLEVTAKDQLTLDHEKISTTAEKDKDLGELSLSAEMSHAALRGKVKVQLTDDKGKTILDEFVQGTQFRDGIKWNNLKIKRWWPNGAGEQPLYRLVCTLFDEAGNKRQDIIRKIGFKNIQWFPCKGAPVEADPWICNVNNKSIFLQGVNWTPIRPNFADLKEADYRKLLITYKKLGINLLRVWGGGCIEKEWFYDLCDEMGMMLWQEFPLSSSGLDNYPPEDPKMIQDMALISRSYVQRLRHHVSIIIWCGGNELYEMGDRAIVTNKHPMIKCMEEVVKAEDPSVRYVVGSPSGNNIWGGPANFGKGVNWDTHGPWTLPFSAEDNSMKAVEKYWQMDDALMHSEVGVPGASPVSLINKYKGDYKALPASVDNPIWNQFNWWMEWDEYTKGHQGQSLNDIEEYVAWSQDRQTKGLSIALKACKLRFPACGGFIVWMGHDSYPCLINTSIIDFEGNLKPAAYELSKIWKANE